MPHRRPTWRRPRAVGAALALVAVAATVTGLAGAGSASAAASAAAARSDLVVEVTADPAEVNPAGGNVELAVVVRNVGAGLANDVTVKLRPPAGTTLAPPPEPGFAPARAETTSGWRCDDAEWRCAYGALAAGSQAEVLTLRLRLPGGSLGDVATIGATASTSSRETSRTDNTAKAKVTYSTFVDLAMRSMQADPAEVSNLGDRAILHILIANDGTADAADVRVTIDPPPGSRVQEDTFDPFEWQCELAAAPWVCTRGPLKPVNQPEGLHADLIVPVMLPAGTTGDTITMTATVSTSSPERSLADNSGEVSLRYVTPEPADLQIIDMSATPAQVVAGEQVEIGLQVENIGGSPADNVRVRVPLPDTVEPVSADLTGPDWTCSVIPDAETGQRVWECAHPRYEPHSIEYLSRIILTATVGAGTPEGTLWFVATARTDSPELSTDNNAGEASTTYRAQGFIRGQVWLDQDRDGQRDPGEPPVGTAPDGILSLWFMEEGLTWPEWDTQAGWVGPDGSYSSFSASQNLAPGRYFARVSVNPTLDFTVPDTGDEATDSDVARTAGGSEVTAESAVIDVVDGRYTVVDIGLVPAQP
ncbi:MAG TPA: hypothetical protein VHM23_08820 [Actinomycetota bacterium]|jgi:hypothetical protein|nr:hypothetical protein [Actinomycetota bacterium]